MKTLLSMPATAEVTALGNKLFVCQKTKFTNLCVCSYGVLRRHPPPPTHTPSYPPIHTHTHISLVLLSGVSGLLHQVHRADLSCASILHVSTSTRANRSYMTTRVQSPELSLSSSSFQTAHILTTTISIHETRTTAPPALHTIYSFLRLLSCFSEVYRRF